MNLLKEGLDERKCRIVKRELAQARVVREIYVI